jgi:hypothetical protein
MERRNAVCVVEGRLVGEEGGTIVGCVGVVSAQAAPEVYVGSNESLLIRLKLLFVDLLHI